MNIQLPVFDPQTLYQIEQPMDNDERATQLASLATGLLTQFEQQGQMTHLQTAILLLRESRALLPVHHPNVSPASINLALALHTQFQQLGQREDLDECISLNRDWLELLPAPHPDRSIELAQQPRQCTKHTI